jgi:hypothetical protein
MVVAVVAATTAVAAVSSSLALGAAGSLVAGKASL